ncbi:hypothetical protein [Ralstonia phage RP13]|nr:hypothetical protein [Ralstonia phage RP13]
MSGLLQHFTVSADTKEQLINAIKIALVWDKKVTHYKTGIDINNQPYLSFLWSDKDNAVPLIASLDTAEDIAAQVYAWLKNVEYGRGNGGDGSDSKGWHITNQSVKTDKVYSCPWASYQVFVVYPEWIYYGK